MARQSRSRLHFGRMFSPRNKSASAVASVQSQQRRRKARVKKWRERFKRFSLSAWHENTIVATVCDFFRSSAEAARAVRAGTGSQFVGLGNRSLRMESLEQRQMLSATSPTFVDHNWAFVTDTDTSGSLTAGDIVHDAAAGDVAYGSVAFGTVSSGTYTGSVVGAAKIQDAIDNTTTNGIVNVAAGSYNNESINIVN